MPNRIEFLKLQSEILASIDVAKELLLGLNADSEAHEQTLENLNDLRRALVRCEKMLEETDAGA